MNRLSSITKQIAALQKISQFRGGQGLPLGDAAFGSMLQSILTGGPGTYTGVEGQLMLGREFINGMTGEGGAHQASEFAGLTDASMLIDTLSDSGGDARGGGEGTFPGALGGANALATMLETLRNVHHRQRAEAMTTAQHHGAAGDSFATVSAKTDAGAQPGSAAVQAAKAGTTADADAAAGAVMAQAAGHTSAESPSRQAATQAMENKAYGSSEAARLAGLLAARFESNGDPGVIGYDRVGGTSYGMYQISSRAGTFDGFLTYLDRHAPKWAEALRGAGKANTGSTTGAVPAAWKDIAQAEPERFADVQHEFIRETHFLPAARKVAELTGLDLEGEGGVLAQVLWSTAVQHGASGSARIFASAVDAVNRNGADDFGKSLIQEVYAHRSGQFGSSTERVRSAVHSRFASEMELALSLFDGGDTTLSGMLA
jgi:hypothetical protein